MGFQSRSGELALAAELHDTRVAANWRSPLDLLTSSVLRVTDPRSNSRSLPFLFLALLICGEFGCVSYFPPVQGTVEATRPLYDLVARPQVGSFLLVPPWTGQEEIVSRTGVFIAPQKWVPPEQASHALHFDLFTLFKSELVSEEGRATLSHREPDRTLRDLYRHRDRLPNEAQITACKVRAEVKALLGSGDGLDVWGQADELHTTETWRFFILKDASTVETLSVFCLFTHRPETPEWTVDGFRISRGTATEGR